ncbi:MAG: hypothetical protein ACD_79C00032G0002 [uncultured bacterium]|nr:MAG: hypothetical protein ACD_79C00032G0002 [uncultured bacterium]
MNLIITKITSVLFIITFLFLEEECLYSHSLQNYNLAPKSYFSNYPLEAEFNIEFAFINLVKNISSSLSDEERELIITILIPQRIIRQINDFSKFYDVDFDVILRGIQLLLILDYDDSHDAIFPMSKFTFQHVLSTLLLQRTRNTREDAIAKLLSKKISQSRFRNQPELQEDTNVTIFGTPLQLVNPISNPLLRMKKDEPTETLRTTLARALAKQLATVIREDELRGKDFYAYYEMGDTVNYTSLLTDTSSHDLNTNYILNKKNKPIILFINNPHLNKKPVIAGKTPQRVNDQDPSRWRILPKNILKNEPNTVFVDWQGSSGNNWAFIFNQFPIWPVDLTNPNGMTQPLQFLLTRYDKIHQKNIISISNLSDILQAFIELNNEGESFRIGANGWYYSDRDNAIKAGASQAQIHVQGVQFEFPIEYASLKKEGETSGVTIYSINDTLGTGIVLEANKSNTSNIVKIMHNILNKITQKEHSFNFIIVPHNKKIRIFIADRIAGIPTDLIDSEVGYPEFARIFVPLNQNISFNSNQNTNANLLTAAKKALCSITAPQHEIDIIIDDLLLKKNTLIKLWRWIKKSA